MEKTEQKLMHQALALARRGLGWVEPNPAVGAVLVQDGKIIGRGYHSYFGAPHAEVQAIGHARKKGLSTKDAVLYVTLEPCCHWGKTPPCTQAIIDAGIKKVFVATADPSAKVDGKGIEILLQAGVEVQVGLLADEAKELNTWFFHYYRNRQPWIIAKWAQTLDGKLGSGSGHSQWISSATSRQTAHLLRRSCQAIVVGVDTVIADDPQLTVRLEATRHKILSEPPNRVVVDTHLRIPEDSSLVKTADQVPTWVVTSEEADKSKISLLEDKGVRVALLPLSSDERIGLEDFQAFVFQQGWPRILVEGGAKLLSAFILADLICEMVVFQSSCLAVDNQAIQLQGQRTLQVSEFVHSFRFSSASIQGDDVVMRLWRK